MRIAMFLHKSVVHDSRVRREAAALAAAGHDVVVLELAALGEGQEQLDGFRRRSVLPPAWVKRRLPSAVYRFALLAWFVAGARAERPAAVHAHDAAMLLPAVVARRLFGVPVVYDSHELATSVPYRDKAWAAFVAWVERIGIPRCVAVITVSEGIADALRLRYALKRRPVVLRNVSELTPTGRAAGLRAGLGLDADVPLVLHQGAPAPSRGCDVLVRALTHVPDAQLVFLGDPDDGYGPTLRALITELGVEDRVHLVPAVPLEVLLDHTAEADVGVTLLQDTCENHRLALPNKLFEYLAAGVPVVAAALPETEALIARYGVGWTADPADERAVAGALRAALDRRRDAALHARVRAARAELCWPVERERLLELYDALVGAGSPLSGRRTVQLVRNGISHDARVLRASHTLRDQGARVTIVGAATTTDGPGPGKVDGIDAVRLRARSPVGALARVTGGQLGPATAALHRTLTALDFNRRALRELGRLRPDLIHANDHNTMWPALAAKTLWGSRVIYDSHELWPDRNGRRESRAWLIRAERLFVRRADAVITASPGYARALGERYGITTPVVIRNVRDAPEVTTPPRTRPEDEGRRVLAYVGGLMPGRGLEPAIRALTLVDGVVLRATGPASPLYAERLRALAADLGVTDRVELRPAVPPDAVVAELAGADAGLCLIEPICRSYELTLPNKLFEYAAASVPILGSDLEVIGDLVRRHGLGEVADPADVETIAAALQRLFERERHATCAANAQRFALRESWQLERQRLAAVYRAQAPG